MGVSENRGPQQSTINCRILIIIRTPNNAPLIFGKSHMDPLGVISNTEQLALSQTMKPETLQAWNYP